MNIAAVDQLKTIHPVRPSPAPSSRQRSGSTPELSSIVVSDRIEW